MINVLPLLCILLLRANPAFANLSVAPKDTVVQVGDSTFLECSSYGTHLNWIHNSMNKERKHLYINKNITLPGFRMETDKNFRERYLVMDNVTIAIAGKCECVDLGDGEKKPAEVTVIEKLPECSASTNEFIGPNDCKIPMDEILLSCRVTYHGNKFPDLVWRKFGESAALNSNCTTLNDSERICDITMQADLHTNDSSFVCQTTERAAQEQYKCTTKPITILYAFNGEASQRINITKGEKVVCTANSSSSCTYKWVWYEEVGDDLSRTIESTNNTLIAKKIGLHRCEAQCKLRNHACTIFPRYINVIEGNLTKIEDPSALIHQCTSLEKENNQWTPPLIILLILGVLQYFTLVCYLLTRMRRNRMLERDRIPAIEL